MSKVFISYGHDEHARLAERIAEDLEKEGYTVWLDGKSIKVQNFWDNAIEKGIGVSDWVVVLMTPYSMRRPEGVCLDEISYARFQGKEIVPIMVQQVQPPLSIARIQWLDLQNYKYREQYQKGFEAIRKVLKGEHRLGFEGELTHIRSKLVPIEDRVEMGRHMKDFSGRNWVFEQFEHWLENQPDSRVFWLKGPAGIGKSAFSSKLALSYKNVVGIHFFKHSDSDRRDPKRALCSLANYLASQIPDYMNYLLTLPDLRQDTLAEKNVAALFNYLFVEPLNHITPPQYRCVLVLDALDEAAQRSELLSIIGQEFEKVPSWLGLVITSRPEADIVRRLARLEPFELDANAVENLQDIGTFLRKSFEINKIPFNEEQIAQLIEKSEGIFLYITEVINEIKKGRLSLSELDRFPQGLEGVYLSFFERQFPDIPFYKNEVRPFLELVMASLGPLPIEIAKEILKWDEYQEAEILEIVGSLFYIHNEAIEPFHKSIKDWIINRDKCGSDFLVNLKKGQAKLIEYGERQYQDDKNNLSPYYISHYHQHLLEKENWSELEKVITDKNFVILKMKTGQMMDILDFYEVVLQRPTIPDDVKQRIKSYFVRNRLLILFEMYDLMK